MSTKLMALFEGQHIGEQVQVIIAPIMAWALYGGGDSIRSISKTLELARAKALVEDSTNGMRLAEVLRDLKALTWSVYRARDELKNTSGEFGIQIVTDPSMPPGVAKMHGADGQVIELHFEQETEPRPHIFELVPGLGVELEPVETFECLFCSQTNKRAEAVWCATCDGPACAACMGVAPASSRWAGEPMCPACLEGEDKE